MSIEGEKISYAWGNVFKPTPKNVQKWLLAAKGFITTIGVSAYIASHETAAFWMLFSGGVLDFLSQFIASSEE